MLTKAPMDKIESLNEWLGEQELRGLWQGKASLYREPDPFGPARLWKWDTLRAGLEAATELVPTDYRDTRRAIHLSHPSLSGGATNTLAMAVQLVKAGESVFAHRHTLAAMRFVIQGSPDVCTITDGEKCVMERGDLLVQRNWGWHNHINDSSEHAIWIDCLDTGLMSMLRTEFFESHSEEKFQMQHSQVDSAIRTPGALSPPGQAPQKLSYKWSETLPALLDMLPEHKSPFDARVLEYRDPATGGSTFPTFSCWIQMLEPGEETAAHRHTANHVCYAFEGSGTSEVEGEEMVWEEGDFFVVPNWSWHRHRNSSNKERSIIFSCTDRPLMEAVGVYREQAR